ncbi:MAG: metal ABC transporter substrate-binding protein [Bifidobacteriaceae bacterium]|nr:metal ABC transporter substrate-binding protein [Bifidobacteriaceae bacterium]
MPPGRPVRHVGATPARPAALTSPVARAAAPVLALGLALGLAGCGAPAGSGGPSGQAAGGPKVMASFYPLQWLTQRVAGDAVTVGSLTPKGAEPHDSELELSQVSALGQADLLVTLGGFQAAVDDAVRSNPPREVLDAAPLVQLEDGDPHFWLDPTRLAELAAPIAEALGRADPHGAQGYDSRAAAVAAELEDLDRELAEGLAGFQGAVLVTTHAAFRYFAGRYGLETVSVSGVDPEAEPSPARIADVAEQLADLPVKTIYFEDQASPKTAEVLAERLDLATGMLSPLENDASGDYPDAMRANLAELQSGLVAP